MGIRAGLEALENREISWSRWEPIMSVDKSPLLVYTLKQMNLGHTVLLLSLWSILSLSSYLLLVFPIKTVNAVLASPISPMPKSQTSLILMLIKVQPDATVCRYLFTAKSLYMFRVSQHPSSGILKPVTAASGTGTATSLQCGLIRPRWREVAVPVLWPVPEAAVTVFSTADDGCCDTRNM